MIAHSTNTAAYAKRDAVSWRTESLPGFVWFVRIAIPFDYALSKNKMYGRARTGQVFLRAEGKAMRMLLVNSVRRALCAQRIAHNKLWIDLFVEKPDHTGDAVNVVDVVCDAIKEAIPLDDRWYAIRRLDWAIEKEDPMLSIGIGQESDRDVQACSTCGRILLFDAFNLNKSTKLGITTECRECLAVKRRATR
jgi:hypothetical protein